MNELTFNESTVLNKFRQVLQEAFENDTTHTPDYWYNLFGKRDITVYNTTDIKEPQFPCIVVVFYPMPVTEARHSTQIEEFTHVDFTIEHYNKAVGANSKEDIGLQINYLVKQTLQQKFGVTIEFNQPILNIDSTVYRRVIRGRFGYDNRFNIFNKGD